MRTKIGPRTIAFFKGFVAAIIMHGLAFLGIYSLTAVWRLIGHIAGIMVLNIFGSC